MISVVRPANGGHDFDCAVGLDPALAKGHTHRGQMINARAETVANKPGFRDAFRRR